MFHEDVITQTMWPACSFAIHSFARVCTRSGTLAKHTYTVNEAPARNKWKPKTLNRSSREQGGLGKNNPERTVGKESKQKTWYIKWEPKLMLLLVLWGPIFKYFEKCYGNTQQIGSQMMTKKPFCLIVFKPAKFMSCVKCLSPRVRTAIHPADLCLQAFCTNAPIWTPLWTISIQYIWTTTFSFC